VQADVQALIQASKLRACGNVMSVPLRISSMVLNEVISMMKSGSAKNSAEETRNA